MSTHFDTNSKLKDENEKIGKQVSSLIDNYNVS